MIFWIPQEEVHAEGTNISWLSASKKCHKNVKLYKKLILAETFSRKLLKNGFVANDKW